MCGRFSLTKEEAEIEKRFGAKFYSNDLVKRYNVAPGQLAIVITDAEPERLQYLKWGLVPSWAKDVSIGNKMINARAETILEKPSFKNLVRKRRCLVISDGFYEWKPITSKQKQPMRILLKDEELFAMAGLWDVRVDTSTGEELRTFTVITTSANELVAPIHDRMPVMLSRTDEKRWIEAKLSENELTSILRPYPSSLMTIYPVSQLVNTPANDDPRIIQPLQTLF